MLKIEIDNSEDITTLKQLCKSMVSSELSTSVGAKSEATEQISFEKAAFDELQKLKEIYELKEMQDNDWNDLYNVNVKPESNLIGRRFNEDTKEMHFAIKLKNGSCFPWFYRNMDLLNSVAVVLIKEAFYNSQESIKNDQERTQRKTK